MSSLPRKAITPSSFPLLWGNKHEQNDKRLLVQWFNLTDSKIDLYSHRMVEVGRDLWRPSHPTYLPLKPVTQDYVQVIEYLWGWRLQAIFDSTPSPLRHRKHFLMFREASCASVCTHCLWSCTCAPLNTIWLCLLCTFASGTYIHWWDSPKTSCLQAEQPPALSDWGDASNPFVSFPVCLDLSCTGPSIPGGGSPE